MKKLCSVFVALVLVFSGCTRKPTAVTQEETAPQRVEKKKIVIYNLFDPEDTLRGQIQAFTSANRDIDVVYKKFHNVQEYQDHILHELAEGGGPDILALRNDWVPEYRKKLTPAPANITIPAKFSETFLSVVSDDLIAPDDEGFEQVWGMPLYVDTLAVYYNKQLFRDNLPSTNRPADTWNELKEQVFALTKSDNSIERFAVSGLAMGRVQNISHFADIFSLLLIQEGAELFDVGDKRAIFSRSQGVQAGTGQQFFPTLEAIKLYTGFALPSSRHYSWNLQITGLRPAQKEVGAFARGKVAMIFGFSSMYDEIKIAVDGLSRENENTIQMSDVGIAPVPQFSGSLEEGRRDAFAKYYFLGVSRNSAYPQEAWTLLNFLSSPDSLQEYHEKTNKPSPRFDMIEEQMTQENFGVFARQAPYAKSLRTLEPDNFFDIFANTIGQVVNNRITAEQAVQKAERQMTCILTKREKPELDEDCFSL